MKYGIQAGLHDGKDRHRFREAVDRCAPVLFQQKQDGRDERPGVADADPPHEAGDGIPPGDRDHDPPDADADEDQDAHRQQEESREQQARQQAKPPPDPGLLLQDEAVDAVRNLAVRVVRPDDGREPVLQKRLIGADHRAHGCESPITGLTFGTVARYVVRGRVLSSARSV